MTLFQAARLEELRRRAAGSLAGRLAAAGQEPLRRLVERTAERAGPGAAERWAEALTSEEDLRFFQGMAEVTTAAMLLEAGWEMEGIGGPGPCLKAARLPDARLNVMVLAFLHGAPPRGDRRATERLVRTLNRIGGRRRIAMLIRRPVPGGFDPEPVRRAVELWLGDVDRRAWKGRWATFEDGQVVLEFGLTGEETRGRDMVAFCMGPFLSHRTVQALESRLVREMDRYRLGRRPERPVLVACAANEPWPVSPGYLRSLLYGKPDRHVTDGDPGSAEMAVGQEGPPCVFRDPLYSMCSGVLLFSTTHGDLGRARPTAYLNPWADSRIAPEVLGCPALSACRFDSGTAVLRWSRPSQP